MTLGERKWLLIGFAATAALVVLGGAGSAVVYFKTHDVLDSAAHGPIASAPAGQSAGPGTVPDQPQAAPAGKLCDFQPADQGPGEPRLVETPGPRATEPGTVRATMRTNLGALELQLDARAAPCTVHSFVHLAREDYYAETPCHRVTTDGIYVLQCGDPGGTGTGSPGYRYGEENLPTGVTPPYPRGTLAMANAGPGTNGGQFFIVYRDSEIPADYSVFGRVTAGIDIAERVAAAGTDNGGPDGRPKLEIMIDEVVVA